MCSTVRMRRAYVGFPIRVTALELAPDGSGYRMHTRFAKFVNLPELLSMFRSFADVQTADMLHLPRPEIDGGKPHIAAAPASPQLKEYVGTLVERAQKLKSGGIDPRRDNMLKVTGDGRKAARFPISPVADARLRQDSQGRPAAASIRRQFAPEPCSKRAYEWS